MQVLRSKWLTTAFVGILGALLGAIAVVLVLSSVASTSEPLPDLPVAAAPKGKPAADNDLDVRGSAETTLRDLSVHDLEGQRVLHVEELAAVLDLASLRKHVVKISRGRVRGVDVLLRRGASGRVSLAEVLGRSGDSKPSPADSSELALGPFVVRDARLRVVVTGRPIVFQLERATVRITRAAADSAPKIFLSDLHGRMVEPDPLPQPLRIVGGEGVVNLARDPLVDLRTRVCIGGGELRMRIELPDRQKPVKLRAEAEGFTGKAALFALGLVARFKDEKIELEEGTVPLPEGPDCSRAEGRQLKEELDDKR